MSDDLVVAIIILMVIVLPIVAMWVSVEMEKRARKKLGRDRVQQIKQLRKGNEK